MREATITRESVAPPVTDEAHVPLAESRAVHKPFVAASKVLPEWTPRAIILGSILGIIFGASSVYLALRVGLTVSASIPIAVMSISIFRALGRASILENNIAQTTGSAGESIAAGIAFTIPALLVLGYDLEISRTTMVALLGGWLGVLLMIPLRRALIVKEHGRLLYPEGTACAEVLVVGEKGGTDAKLVFGGFGMAALYRFLMSGARLWNETPAYVMRNYQGATVAANITPELLGVGYIIGPRVAAMMLGGGFLSALVLIPTIKFFGAGYTEPLFPVTAGGPLINTMSAGQVQDLYVRYIAAGAVAAGGIISLIRTLPMIVGAFLSTVGGFNQGRKASGRGRTAAGVAEEEVPRTERDMPLTFVLGGILVLAIAIFIWLTVAGSATGVPSSGVLMNILSVLLVLVFGFFFATVSSRITGELGSSSNPISGMTIAAILLTSLIFLILGMGGADSRVLALSVGAVVCIALSNAGTTSQDLKTGFLVGATPSRMQWGLMVGVTTSALVIAWTLSYLNNAYTNLLPVYYPTYSAQLSAGGEPWARGDMRGGELAGGPYFVHRLPVDAKGSDGQIIPSGKYLVDGGGEIHYRINPGVGGTRTAVTSENLPPGPLVAGADVEFKGRARGLDNSIYNLAVVRGGGGETPRTFYVDEQGRARFEEVTTGPASKFDAPKAQLMAILVDGVLTQKLPWSLILIGVFISVLLEIVGVSALPFAVGMYLSIATSATIFVGGLVRALVERGARGKLSRAEEESGPGILYSSGLIAGGTIMGLLLTIPQSIGRGDLFGVVQYLPAWLEENRLTALVMFSLLAATLYYVGMYGLDGRRRARAAAAAATAPKKKGQS
ncbi:MAG TPA: oligopeptide transporter, OPT family [Pyrinomonadaceae bacterium]|jgi:putative OPT family oligopeptide transporter|nr:oligopeptide transporter, OPT family [Pyrinomonadaceae bacterium]